MIREPPLPIADKDRFELLLDLENDEFKCIAITSSAEKKAALKTPYEPSKGDKVWYLSKDGKASNYYLQSLLQADSINQAIPHLSLLPVYRKLLDPAWEPKSKPERLCLEYGELACEDAWEEMPSPKKKRRRGELLAIPPSLALRPPRVVASALPWDGPDDDDDDKDEQSGSNSDCDSNGSGSSKRSDNSGSDDSKSNSEASNSSTSNSGSNSSSGSSSSGAKKKRANIPYGVRSLTQRFGDGGEEIIGYQANCAQATHFGKKGCSREMAVSVAGTTETCRRMLKAWLLFGHGCPERASHGSST